MLNRLRTWAFALVFYGLSVVIVLASPLAAMFGSRVMMRYVRGWALVHRWSARWLLGITVRMQGVRPDRPAFYAAKHQAMFETIELVLLLGAPAIVLKQELAQIPVWGWAARRYGAIVVDRDASAGALRRMLREAAVARKAGRSVLIFPEGTRVAPGDQPPLKSGFAGLYRMLAMPTVPVALDTGRVWPRHGAKRPGVVTVRLGEVLPPGLAREEVEARVHAAINVLDGVG